MITRRGLAVLLLAGAAYLGGRWVGTYELYLTAVVFTVLVVIMWGAVVWAARTVSGRVDLSPPNPCRTESVRVSVHVDGRMWGMGGVVWVDPASGGWPTRDVGLRRLPLETRSGSGAESTGVLDFRADYRGAFTIRRPQVTIEDPFGLAAAGVKIDEKPRLVVLPRRLRADIPVLGGPVGVLSDSRSPAAAVAASGEFVGIRPHEPGESLSRIDWKGTARTGQLMLRETGDTRRTDVLIAVDGTRAGVVGEPPEDTFERSVEIAGALGDAFLRAGRAVTLFFPEGRYQTVRIVPGENGRYQLQHTLVGARPDVSVPFARSLLQSVPGAAGALTVIAVSPAFDRRLGGALRHLRERGIPVLLAHLDLMSFSGRAADGHSGEGRFLLGMQHSGVDTVIVRRDGDLQEELSSAAGHDSERRGLRHTPGRMAGI